MFQKFLFSKLKDQKNALCYGGKLHVFEKMNCLYDNLLRLPGCTAQATGVPMPTPVVPGIVPPGPVPTV